MTGSSGRPGQKQPPVLDTGVPHTARTWNYWLGGKDNYPADRKAGDAIRALMPEIVDAACASGRFWAAPSGT